MTRLDEIRARLAAYHSAFHRDEAYPIVRTIKDIEFLLKECDALMTSFHHAETERWRLARELDDAAKAGTPYWRERDTMNGLIVGHRMLQDENARLRAALERIEQNTRNQSVIGHPGVECRECYETNLACGEALHPQGEAAPMPDWVVAHRRHMQALDELGDARAAALAEARAGRKGEAADSYKHPDGNDAREAE